MDNFISIKEKLKNINQWKSKKRNNKTEFNLKKEKDSKPDNKNKAKKAK